MKIGIIGAGPIGAALTRQYTKAGHDVKISNASGIEKLRPLAEETGAKPVSLAEVVVAVEVLVVAIPLVQIPKLSTSIGQSIEAKTVIIDTTNYYPLRDGRIDEIEHGMPESVWVSGQLQHPVVKVYNSIIAGSLIQSGLPQGAPLRIALPISGDDPKAKSVVATLVNDSGFDALDIGNLEESWRQQPGSPVYCTDLDLQQLKKNSTKVIRELLGARRELSLQFILKQNPDQWMDWRMDCVRNNRHSNESDLSV
jgi:predicted dinucleotide-binding enzyme